MKNQKLLSFGASVLVLITLAGCQKEQPFDQNLSYEDHLNTMVDQAWEGMVSGSLFPENPLLGIEMLNDGIAADFLLDETFLNEMPERASTNPANWIYIHDHSFIKCFRGLDLSTGQITSIREGLMAYKECKADAVQRAHALYRELRHEYQQVFQRLLTAYRNGALTEREFRLKVSELRNQFRQELRRLQLREKLDLAFKQCLRDFLGELHGILTGRQWKAFVECYRLQGD